jgi:hypothetical protein
LNVPNKNIQRTFHSVVLQAYVAVLHFTPAKPCCEIPLMSDVKP